MRKTTLFASLALTAFAAALRLPSVRAQAVPAGQAGQARRDGGALGGTEVERRLYVAVPGVGNATDHGGIGILVFDIDHGYKFVKRIPTWTPAAGARAEGVRGIAAHAATAG